MVNSERVNCGAIRQRKRQRQTEKQHLIVRLESEESKKLRSILSAWKPDIDGQLWQEAAGGAAVLELTKMGVGILAPPGRPPPVSQ